MNLLHSLDTRQTVIHPVLGKPVRVVLDLYDNQTIRWHYETLDGEVVP